jgi:hypothetical protein
LASRDIPGFHYSIYALIMETAINLPETSAPSRKILVSPDSRHIPHSVPLLNQWQYVERTIHRLLAAWGRHMSDWDGKATLHRHVWDQAEIIRRIRTRIAQFPGGKPDAPVSSLLANLADTALLAPCFEDALDGIYKYILQGQTKAYVEYVQNAHPVHDGPSLSLFHEINTIKEQHFFWYRSYRRQFPHTTDRTYEQALQRALSEAGALQSILPLAEGSTIPCRPTESFQLPQVSRRPAGWAPNFDIYPYFSADFANNIESRRLFWGTAYLQEMNLPDDQLAWLYYGDYMPWDWHYDISRHLWDESRHGCSGYSRLQDWGISLHDVGFHLYHGEHLRRHPEGTPLVKRMIKPYVDEARADFSRPMTALTPDSIYQAVFHVGMVAESGHFIVKNEGYDDFRAVQDLESAEMMLFDIIDETAHVQYAHRWLPLLAEHAKIDNSDYRARAVQERKRLQEHEIAFIKEAESLPRNLSFGPWRHYQDLLAKVRQACPILDSANHRPRSIKPM